MHAPARQGGVLLVAKAAGVTSHDVVKEVRRSPPAQGAGERAKVGHAGTLDPFATGLLLVLVGRATRVQRYFTALPKCYRVSARFGVKSDTGDPTGVLETTGGETSAEAVRAALPALTGDLSQCVPLTSAVKVGGERLYRKARRGEQFETPVRDVRVDRFELTRFDEEERTGTFEVECSSGTYVRRLVEDLGEQCGAGAYCSALERTRIGPFRLEDADDRRLIGLAEALSFMPERGLAPEETRLVRNGAAVPVAGDDVPDESQAARLMSGDELVAIAERRGRKLKPVTVLFS